MDAGKLIRIVTEKRRVMSAAIEGAVVYIDSEEEREGLRAAHWDYSRSVDALISTIEEMRSGACIGTCPHFRRPTADFVGDGFFPLTLN